MTDVNDCDPKFLSRDHAYVFVDEPVGYPLIYVAAVDDDWLENGRVTYRIASGNENGQFHLNGTSGMQNFFFGHSNFIFALVPISLLNAIF